ncbi:hypothetical protein FBQ98_12555 [Gammaproteobacteria bacterium PRO6]|nr:hypothetical protein [Gammaproteobacteria bacterium PRO6]
MFGLLACVDLAKAQTLVIRNVALVDPDELASERSTLVLRDGVIAAIENPGARLSITSAREIDGNALFAMPGLMDAHVHAHRDGREA